MALRNWYRSDAAYLDDASDAPNAAEIQEARDIEQAFRAAARAERERAFEEQMAEINRKAERGELTW